MSPKAREPSEALALRDTLDDLLAGFRIWRDDKVGHGELDFRDEMLVRWVEAGPAKEML